MLTENTDAARWGEWFNRTPLSRSARRWEVGGAYRRARLMTEDVWHRAVNDWRRLSGRVRERERERERCVGDTDVCHKVNSWERLSRGRLATEDVFCRANNWRRLSGSRLVVEDVYQYHRKAEGWRFLSKSSVNNWKPPSQSTVKDWRLIHRAGLAVEQLSMPVAWWS